MRTAQHETSLRTRTVAGVVASTGEHKSGVGFTSYKATVGVYVVIWTFPVARVLELVAQPHAGTVIFAVVDPNWTPPALIVRMLTSASALIDTEFGFTATVVPK